MAPQYRGGRQRRDDTAPTDPQLAAAPAAAPPIANGSDPTTITQSDGGDGSVATSTDVEDSDSPSGTVVVVVVKKRNSGLSTTVIIVISACGGLAVILFVVGCCIARRRRGKKNDWLTALLSSDVDAQSTASPSTSKAKEAAAVAPPPPATPAQPTISQLPMMGMPQFLPMFGGLPPQQIPPQPMPPPPQSQPAYALPPSSMRQPTVYEEQRSMTGDRSRREYSTPSMGGSGIPHHPGLPSIEPNVYDDGAPTRIDAGEKNKWLRKARQGLTSSQVPDLLPPDRPPSPDHTVWEGPAGSQAGSDWLTSISRRHLKNKPRAAMPAPQSSSSSQQRKRRVSLTESDLVGPKSRAAPTQQSGSRGGSTRQQPVSSFSLNSRDLEPPTSSYRGQSNNGMGANSTLATSFRPRNRRIDQIRADDQSTRRSR